MSRTRRFTGRPSHDFPQSAADAITFHRISYLFRDREADPGWAAVAAIAHLNDESLGRDFDCGGGSQEIRPVPQSLHAKSCAALVSRIRSSLNLAASFERTSEPPRSRRVLGAQAFATAGSPGLHDPSAALGGHSGAETVTALAHELARLVRPFHESLSAVAACRR